MHGDHWGTGGGWWWPLVLDCGDGAEYFRKSWWKFIMLGAIVLQEEVRLVTGTKWRGRVAGPGGKSGVQVRVGLGVGMGQKCMGEGLWLVDSKLLVWGKCYQGLSRKLNWTKILIHKIYVTLCKTKHWFHWNTKHARCIDSLMTRVEATGNTSCISTNQHISPHACTFIYMIN